MSSGSSSGLLGVVILARHGDREGFYQDPLTYTAALTSITPLGDVRCPLSIILDIYDLTFSSM